MKQVQRKTERRISAALRLVLVALLLLLQIAIVVALTRLLAVLEKRLHKGDRH